jgi:DNA-binding protein HU-beta
VRVSGPVRIGVRLTKNPGKASQAQETWDSPIDSALHSFVAYKLRQISVLHALQMAFSSAEPGGYLIKLDIINEVVNRTGITKTKAEMAVETVFDTMKKALSDGDRIELRGFGIFNVRPRKTGIGRNPRTGAEVAIPPGKAVRFKPGKELQALQ